MFNAFDGLGDGGRGRTLWVLVVLMWGGGGVSHPSCWRCHGAKWAADDPETDPERLAGRQSRCCSMDQSPVTEDDGGRPDGADWPEDGGGQDAPAPG